jgi:hypothetical protein
MHPNQRLIGHAIKVVGVCNILLMMLIVMLAIKGI